MPLSPGTRLGPYEIVAALGAGGMGEVYRARDARLNRDVAIKVLPTGVADNPTRRARFTREAQAIAQLSHPHICAIYDVGEENGVAYLVMEYIDGQSLEQRLRLGPLPWAATLPWAIQMASAIQAAHRRGIVHRDLKPANVMIAESGVKLLDFGLAKLLEGSEVAESERANQSTASLTSEQRFVGTLHYMAPEQLEGRQIDERTDVFAFGVTLYEMVTSRKAFDGASAASISAAILTAEPRSVSASMPGDPVASAALDHVIQRALAKDPDERWQTARDLTLELQWILEGRARSAPVASGRDLRRAVVAVSAALSLAAAAMLGWYAGIARRAPAAESPIEFTIEAPPGTTLDLGFGVALSPDGRKIAFSAGPGNGSKLLYWRSLDSPASHPILGTEGVSVSFWSPDSAAIGFYADNHRQLKRVSLASGAVTVIVQSVETTWITTSPGAYWSPDETIVFAQSGGLYRVPAQGGEPALITSSGFAPAPLSDGRWMYREDLGDGSSVIRVVGPGLATPVTLPVSSNAVFAAGYLLFREGQSLVARPFDDRAVRFTGRPVTLSESVSYSPANGRISLTATSDVLVYKQESPGRLTWVDRDGNAQGSIGEVGRDSNPSLAPDGSGRVGIDRWDPVTATYHVWVLDDHQGATQLTHGGRERFARWSPDGRWIGYWFRDAGTTQIRRTRSNGEGSEETLVTGSKNVPLDFSRDSLLYQAGPGNDLFATPLGGGDRIPITNTPSIIESTASFSPNGRWIAYTSNEGGQDNIWVQEFPSGASRHAVTTKGGMEPHWRSSDGLELFYVAPDGFLTAVPVIGPGMTFGPSKALFKFTPGGWRLYSFAPSANGQRFLVDQRVESPGVFTVVVNWTSRVR